MTRDDVSIRLRAVIVDQLGVEEHEVTPEAHLIDDLGMDSLDLVEAVCAAEEEFGLDPVADDEWEVCRTVRDLTDVICRALEAKTP